MIINKKVKLNMLGFYVGTKCNLQCKHCAGGDPHSMVISESVVDDVLANVDSICSIHFYGYEATLYKHQIQMILDKVIQNHIPVNYIILHTNMVVYDEELAKIFNDFRLNHTINPDASTIVYSTDTYHFHNGFTIEKLYENVEKYKKYVGNCQFEENDLNQGLYLSGRAKNMDYDDLEFIDEIFVNKYPMTKCKFRKDCKGFGLYCKGGRNCVETPIAITPNGYVFAQDMEALRAISKNDYSNCIGHISDKSIYDMVQQHKDDKKGEVHIFRDRNSFAWHFRYVIYMYLRLRKKALNALTNQAPFHLFTKYLKELTSIKEYSCSIKLNKKCEFDTSDLYSLSQLLEQIDYDFNLVKCIAELYNRFDLYGKNLSKVIELQKKLSDSFFDPSNFKSHFGLDYELFVSMWESYYAMDIDKFCEVMDLIDEDIKSNAKFKFN